LCARHQDRAVFLGSRSLACVEAGSKLASQAERRRCGGLTAGRVLTAGREPEAGHGGTTVGMRDLNDQNELWRELLAIFPEDGDARLRNEAFVDLRRRKPDQRREWLHTLREMANERTGRD
jgi:hypothetical protein